MANVPITSLPVASAPAMDDYLIIQGASTQRIKWSTLLDKLWPVGSIYQSSSSTSPASLFGGTWEQIKDQFILAAGDTYAAGSTGGEATHKLTDAEMPRHAHNIAKGSKNTNGAGTKFEIYDAYQSESSIAEGYYWTATTLFAGNSKPHNNMPPYVAMYIWKRIA